MEKTALLGETGMSVRPLNRMTVLGERSINLQDSRRALNIDNNVYRLAESVNGWESNRKAGNRLSQQYLHEPT